MKNILLAIFIIFTFNACNELPEEEPYVYDENDTEDLDNDYIPNNIEKLIGSDFNDSDEDNDSIVDGLSLSSSNGDEFFKYQWYIKNDGLSMNPTNDDPENGNDLDLMIIYHNYMGYGVNVQVNDMGIDVTHEDLSANMNKDYCVTNGVKGVYPVPVDYAVDTHGTMVSGIIASRAFNGKGTRGVAPFASLSGSDFLKNSTTSNISVALGINGIDISNNSWGAAYSKSLIDSSFEYATSHNRDDKGTNIVFSTGNNGIYFKYAGTQYNEYITSNLVIPVAAINDDNKVSIYSDQGHNVLVSAYGGHENWTNTGDSGPTIATTYNTNKSSFSMSWFDDSQLNYTYTMNGTSAAAPMVSGALALVLNACPDLTHRDIKHLIATTSIQIDDSNTSWVQNSANLIHSPIYGYGLINPRDMIRECEDDSFLSITSDNYIKKTITLTPNDTLKFANGKFTYSFNLDNGFYVEYAEVNIDTTHTMSTELDVILTSPNGTQNMLLKNMGTILNKDYWVRLREDGVHSGPDNWMDGGHRLGSWAYVDENSTGTWNVSVQDMIQEQRLNDYDNFNTGVLKSITLTIYGHDKTISD